MEDAGTPAGPTPQPDTDTLPAVAQPSLAPAGRAAGPAAVSGRGGAATTPPVAESGPSPPAAPCTASPPPPAAPSRPPRPVDATAAVRELRTHLQRYAGPHAGGRTGISTAVIQSVGDWLGKPVALQHANAYASLISGGGSGTAASAGFPPVCPVGTDADARGKYAAAFLLRALDLCNNTVRTREGVWAGARRGRG